eukprot:scaffold32301_cov135-Isochrysis_galbana.AAC.21
MLRNAIWGGALQAYKREAALPTCLCSGPRSLGSLGQATGVSDCVVVIATAAYCNVSSERAIGSCIRY